MLILMCSAMVAAQSPAEVNEDFSKDELESFVEAYEEVQIIQQESGQRVTKAIEGNNLTVDRFNEIMEQQQDPGKNTDATAEEMAAFNSAAQSIIKERQLLEKKMISAIEEVGIDTQTYQEIMVAYQQSPKVQERINEMLTQ